LNDRDSVFKAIQGSSAVFGVTNCKFRWLGNIRPTLTSTVWEKNSSEAEIAQGKAMADAAKATGTEHFIWSSLPNVSKETNGKLTEVLHFDSKAAVETYIRSINLPASFFMPGFFMSNIAFKANDKGVLAWTTPFKKDTKVPLLDAAGDTGAFVAAALLDGKPSGKRILGSSGYATVDDIVATWAKVTGKEAVANTIPLEVYKSFLPPAFAEDLGGNMQLVISPGYYVGEPASGVDDTVALVAKTGAGKLTSWEDFVKKTAAKA
jgi:uncharacterized protein YbjT (DUF2867 family)